MLYYNIIIVVEGMEKIFVASNVHDKRKNRKVVVGLCLIQKTRLGLSFSFSLFLGSQTLVESLVLDWMTNHGNYH